MITASVSEKMNTVQQLSIPRRREIFIELLTFVCKFKNNSVEVDEIISIYDGLCYFLDSRFRLLKLHEIVNACENGMTGTYGKKDFKFTADTIVGWVGNYTRDSSNDRSIEAVQERTKELDKTYIEVADSSYPKALLMRIKFNPGGLKKEYNLYNLDMIAAKIREGINIFENRPIRDSDFDASILNARIIR